MDPGWDHTENEDKLLLGHTLWMGTNMGTVMDLDMYSSEVRSLSGIGCSSNKLSTAHGLISLNTEYNRHISTISGNILNANQYRMSTLSIEYIPYFYSVFPLHPNTFHRLFQHSTQPQLDQLKNLITEFHKLNEIVNTTLVLLYGVIVYLGVMAYVILAHLAYLITSILQFNVIRIYYTFSVLISLLGFVAKIKLILIETSTYLHALMEILILHFCVMINYIFGIIKAKLLFYLKLVEFQIFIDYMHLYLDLELYKEMLSKLQSEVDKYIKILEKVKGLLKALNKLNEDKDFFKEIIEIIKQNKLNKKLNYKFSYKNDKISEIIKNLSTIKLLRSIELTPDKDELVMNLKINLGDLQKESSDIITMNIDLSTITDFQKGVQNIKNILDVIDMADTVVSTEIVSIIRQLLIVETINLVKLNLRIYQIQLKYFDILIREYLLICTIEFYQQIATEISKLFGLMKFDCSKVSEFLGKCSEVEKNGQSICQKIEECIEKLATVSNKYKIKKFEKLNEVLLKFIWIIVRLKFYVDLIAREILIFKTIILTLVQMSVSSAILDELIEVIGKIKDIDEAIPRLMAASEWLRAFYTIQLENTLVIFGLSELLLFSESIHGYYYVLLLNLYWINWLIWVIECYINQLFVFSYVTKSLNAIFGDIGKELQIITEINNVMKAMATITNKLKYINNSMKQLNQIESGMNIVNWKQSANKIRNETKSISRDIGEINSQIDLISESVKSILRSWDTLVSLYYVLLVLILQVMVFIKITDNRYNMGLGIRNRYYRGLIVSVMEPCNKQLKFILGYLIVMTVVMRNLIKIVHNTILMIYVKIGWLYGLTTKLKEHVDKIDKGVVAVECAIEGVILNFIKCSTKQLSTHLTNLNESNKNRLIKNIGDQEVGNQVVDVYSVVSVNQYRDLVNRMLEFWTFCDESVELFKYIRFCLCSLNFESRYREERPSTFDYPLYSIRTSDINRVSEMVRHTMAENVGNHMCLCLVIKYHLRPTLLKCILFLRNEELGTLDTISRKFDNYNGLVGVKSDLWKLFFIVIISVNNIINYVHKKNKYRKKKYCFCITAHHRYYNYFVSIMLVLSSLIENIWSMDTESARMSIEFLSTLYSQLESYDFSSLNDTKKLSCTSVYTLLVDKDCKKKCQCKGAQKCCCWCVTCFNLLVMCVSLCLQCKLCNAICNKEGTACKIEDWKKCFEVKDCKCTCQQNKGLCCLLKLALCSQLPSNKGNGCSEELEKVLEKCCNECQNGKGCCKTLVEKVKKGLCKLLLLGCCCNDAKCGCVCPEGEVKKYCVLFNNPYRCTSVALVVFCKCGEQAKGCSCLYTLVDKCKSAFDKICQGKDCCCEELKDCCEKLCCPTDCAGQCVCAQLKKSLETICKGCNSDINCLCKEIEKIKDCCFGGKECQCCKNKEGCCRCPPCKIVAQGVILLTRACRANVLEPYKRITIELLNSTKNHKEVIRTLVEGINRTTVNNIYLVKNNLLTSTSYQYSVGSYTDTINSVTNVETRNWGYDTKYEHDVSTDKGFSNQYPYVTNRDNSMSSNSGSRVFKMVLSRMLVGGVIVFMFLYLRVSYSINNPFCILYIVK